MQAPIISKVQGDLEHVRDEDTTYGRSMIYLVSKRGADNFYARIVNGCDVVYSSNPQGTASVTLTPSGRYTFTVCTPFFDALKPGARKIIVIHEAGHIVLRHIERLFNLLNDVVDPGMRDAVMAVFNLAADFEVNDTICRLEPEFEKVHVPRDRYKNDPGMLCALLPEEWGLPRGCSMEQYIRLMLKDLDKLKQKMEQLMSTLEQGDSGQGGDSNGEGDGDQQGDDGSSQASSGNSPGKGAGSKSKRPSRAGKGGGEPFTGILGELADKAAKDPGAFELMKALHDQLSRKAHEQWAESAKNATPEERISMSNKLKTHGRQLVKTAEAQTRDRGFLPGSVRKSIEALLKEEPIPWHVIFADIVSSAIAGKVLEEMAMPNMTLLHDDFVEPWPGFTLDRSFHIVFAVDTSGSMGDSEFARACAQINAILRLNKFVKLTVIHVDTALQREEVVDNIEPPSEDDLRKIRERAGYGGTSYVPLFKRICGIDTAQDWLSPEVRPQESVKDVDLVVVATDGGVSIEGEVFPQYRPNIPIVWLVMPGCYTPPGMSDIAPDRVVKMVSQEAE